MADRALSPFARYGSLVVAVVGISCSAILIRLSDSPPLSIAANRMFWAEVLLVAPVLVFARRELAALTLRDVLGAAASGLCLALHFGLWTVSLSYTSVASSVMFVTTHPVF